MRWAFWRSAPKGPQRALPDDVGLPTAERPPAAPVPPDPDDREPRVPASATSGARPSTEVTRTREAPLTAPAPDLDRATLATTGADLAEVVRAVRAGTPVDARPDARTLAVAATGALAGRLPPLSGVDGAAAFGEPEDELLHAYADLLATRAVRRAADREDLLAVAHVAAAAVAVGAADEPALLLLAGVPVEAQLRAAALLLAQTAQDGAGPVDRLAQEVRALFGAPG